jgi:hypothetical protein
MEAKQFSFALTGEVFQPGHPYGSECSRRGCTDLGEVASSHVPTIAGRRASPFVESWLVEGSLVVRGRLPVRAMGVDVDPSSKSSMRLGDVFKCPRRPAYLISPQSQSPLCGPTDDVFARHLHGLMATPRAIARPASRRVPDGESQPELSNSGDHRGRTRPRWPSGVLKERPVEAPQACRRERSRELGRAADRSER